MRRNINPTTIVFILLMVMMAFRHSMYGMGIREWLIQELYLIPGIIIGLTFHEFGHAFVADKLGDSTPRLQGRVSLNPAAHVDLVGLCALLFVGFGWGRPVEIDPANFKKPRRDEFLVSIAGVTMNLLLAIVFTAILKILYITMGQGSMGTIAYILQQLVLECIFINFVLMIFNLLPVPPLDGFNIITEIFNLKKYSWWYKLYNNGIWILLILILFNFTGLVLSPILSGLMNLVYGVL